MLLNCRGDLWVMFFSLRTSEYFINMQYVNISSVCAESEVQNALQLSVVRPKPKVLQQPIRSQSELEVKTNKLLEAWENLGGQGTTALRFEFDFLRE